MTTSGCASAPERGRGEAILPSASLYLARLHDGIARTRLNMPMVIQSANIAARRVTSGGGRLFAGGSQAEFSPELIGRAGGLACIASPPPPPQLTRRSDVILYAAPSRLDLIDNDSIARWREAGAYVIVFASAALTGPNHFRPDALIDSGPSPGIPLVGGSMIPTDTTINLINAWTWVGEFVAACTRIGRTPVLYQSPDTLGAAERSDLYAGKAFHDDFALSPIETGVLGRAYLDCIESRLLALRASINADEIGLAAAWLREAQPFSAAALCTGPLYPNHFADPRAPRRFAQVLPLVKGASPAARFVAVFGYERPPQLQIEAAHMRRYRLFYSTVQRGSDDASHNIVYVDPQWPEGDACVRAKGYDVRILPASSVMQSALYWSIVAEASRPGGVMVTSKAPGE